MNHDYLQLRPRQIIMIPARYVSEVLRRRWPSRFQGIASSRPPSPSMRKVVCQRTFDELYNVLADVWQKLEAVSVAKKSAKPFKAYHRV
jgi:hypothetical protein